MFNNKCTKLAVAVTVSLSAVAVQAAQIEVNGGFETGDFTGWAQYPSGGTTQSITTVNPSSGTYAANVNIPVGAGAVNNVLKQERLLDGTGLLSAGDIISYSFDVRGSAADGGVLFLENFCETDSVLCGQDLQVINATSDWQTITGDFTLGAGVTAYTLQFAAVCGATATCTADYYFDNVSVTADVNAVPVPAAAWLFGSGLIGLVGMARRKKTV
ncbi:MAG: VPLPA-CTERM sorting domain-containing protein [Gammaproteobacteria bacterium]